MKSTPITSIRGFSLLELLIAVAIFTLVMTIASGALVTMLGVNLKNRTTVVATNNLNVAFESMIRMLERADEGGFSVTASSTQIAFTTYSPEGGVASAVAYRLESERIERQIDGGSWTPITGSSVRVTELVFEKNSPVGAGSVESIRIFMAAEVGDPTDPAGLSDIVAQTTVSQSTTIQMGTTTASSTVPSGNNIPYCGIPDVPGLALEALDAEKSSYSTLESSGGLQSKYYAFVTPIPAGTYDVELAGWDEHCAFQENGVFSGCAQGVQNERWGQDFERLTAEIHYAGGGSEYVSGITDDLPCGENFRTMVADGTVVDTTPAKPWEWSVYQQKFNACWTDPPTYSKPDKTNPSCSVNDPNKWPWGWGEVSSPMECINYFDETHDFSVGEIDTAGKDIVGVTIHHAGCDGNTSRDPIHHPFYATWGSDPCPKPPGKADLLGPGNPPWVSGHSIVPACIGFAPAGSPGGGSVPTFEVSPLIRE